MKRKVAVALMVSMIGLTGAYQASAYMDMNGDNGSARVRMGMAAPAQMDQATKAKFDAFMKETTPLRKSMVQKRAEKNALMQADNPDAKRVAALAGELFDLRSEMKRKAEEAGLSQFMGRGGRPGGNSGMNHSGEHRPAIKR